MRVSGDRERQLKDHWAEAALGEGQWSAANAVAHRALILKALKGEVCLTASDVDLLERVATAYEIVALEGMDPLVRCQSSPESKEVIARAQAGASKAFELRRVMALPSVDDERLFHVLHLMGLGYFSERWVELKSWLHETPQARTVPEVDGVDWDKRLLYRIFDCWIRLIQKSSWDDLSEVASLIEGLRQDQAQYETKLLDNQQGESAQCVAMRLVALYHWAKATERLALFMLQGEPISIKTELDQHFEAALKAVALAGDPLFEVILRWLYVASYKMVDGSLWWVAHTVNSRVTRFVTEVTKNKALFELLPPQRVALQEAHLLDQANRAVVVEMPTSGGKTALAQFRMLQALNQFDQDDGWVAYVAPTRALVSQITRRLREDFAPLGINVEPLTGAIEVDAFEEALLEKARAFQILVATPEKLQLVIRNKKVSRPLALVVMDEAHNLEEAARGLRIELLLATIKQESPRANFLLLMPYVPNASDLSQWLGGDRGLTISLGTTAWKPNERIVGMFEATNQNQKRGDWKLTFETLTMTQGTLHLKGVHEVGGVRPLNSLTYTKAKTRSNTTAAMAKVFSQRGTSIAVASKISEAWKMARHIASALPVLEPVPEDVKLVQRYLATEISPEFELIAMLDKGVAVHHAGLPAEALTLIEWLTEKGYIRVLCATTTIAQGLNFPVSSVFLASTKFPFGTPMSHRAFWNLASRAGRIGHDSVGVIGIAKGDNPLDVQKYVSEATGDLISRLETMLDDLQQAGNLDNLESVIEEDQWTDFRSYLAHLWNEKQNLNAVISEAEQLLRSTYGFGALRARSDPAAKEKADALLKATKHYIRGLANHPENATLADVTGFSPEGVRSTLLDLRKLETKLSLEAWRPTSLFGSTASILPELMGVMMRAPQLREPLAEIVGESKGPKHDQLALITQAWVSGDSLKAIATTFFKGDSLTDQLSKACRAVYRDLANNGAWGLSALSKLPTSGLDFEAMSADDRRQLNLLPAMLYHGVQTQEGVLMRMRNVPRSIAEAVGKDFKRHLGSDSELTPTRANAYLKGLTPNDWERLKPKTAILSGADYQTLWKHLSGE